MGVAPGDAYQLDPQVALRPEPFGALCYHYANRRLTFLTSPDMVAVVEALDDHPSVGDALRAAGVAETAMAGVPRRSRLARGIGRHPCSLTGWPPGSTPPSA